MLSAVSSVVKQSLYTGCGKKSNPLKYLLFFFSNRLEFLCKILHIYRYVTILSILKCQWHLILFKYDEEVIDILARPPSDFRALKNV